MDKLTYLPSQYFPAPNTQARKALMIVADGLSHPKADFFQELGDDPRSALQALRGDAYGFWLIHNLGDKKGIYQLDSRHLSSNRGLDQQARIQAEIEYTERSRKKSEQGAKHLPKALENEAAAKAKASQQHSFEFFNFIKKPAKA